MVDVYWNYKRLKKFYLWIDAQYMLAPLKSVKRVDKDANIALRPIWPNLLSR